MYHVHSKSRGLHVQIQPYPASCIASGCYTLVHQQHVIKGQIKTKPTLPQLIGFNWEIIGHTISFRHAMTTYMSPILSACNYYHVIDIMTYILLLDFWIT